MQGVYKCDGSQTLYNFMLFLSLKHQGQEFSPPSLFLSPQTPSIAYQSFQVCVIGESSADASNSTSKKTL